MRTFFGFDNNNNNIADAQRRDSDENERSNEAMPPPRTLAQDLRDLAGVLSNPAVQAVVGE